MKKPRIVYEDKELSPREKGIFLYAMAIGVSLGTVMMVALRVVGII